MVGRSRGVVAVVSPLSGSGAGPCVVVKYPLRALLMTVIGNRQRISQLAKGREHQGEERENEYSRIFKQNCQPTSTKVPVA